MKIFGTIYPFIETGEQSFKLGRHVANYEFFRSLLSESSFDEFHVFCMSVSHFTMTKNRLLKESIPASQKQKVKLFLYNHLVDQMRSTLYHVFHLGGWGYFFPGLVYLRNKYAKNKFPITGLIHSLNGIETNYHALKICTAPLLAYDTIICSSNAGKKVLENIFSSINKQDIAPAYQGAITIIPLGINEALLKTPPKKECRNRLSLAEKDIVFLHVGRLSPNTKADLYPLIKVFNKLVRNTQDKSLKLILAGGADSKQAQLVNGMISEFGLEKRVQVVNNFTDALKPDLYGASDIYVSLSDNLQETFGISVIEAMAAGQPCVVSDINGYRELIEHKANGFKIPTLWTDRLLLTELADIMDFETMQLFLAQCMAIDTEALYSCLNELILDDNLRTVTGENAQKTVKQNYLWRHIIKKYEELWDSLYEQSVSYPNEIPIKENPFLNDYLSLFKHYPTAAITDNDMCAITEDGKEVLKTGKIPLTYSNIGSIITGETVIKILNYISEKPPSIGGIVSLESLPVKQDEIRYSLLWMAKYSLIHINKGKPS